MLRKFLAPLAALAVFAGLFFVATPDAFAGTDAMCYTGVVNNMYQMHCWDGTYNSKWYAVDVKPWNKALWDNNGHKIATISNYWWNPTIPQYNGYGYRDGSDNAHQITCVLYQDCQWVTH